MRKQSLLTNKTFQYIAHTHTTILQSIFTYTYIIATEDATINRNESI